MTDGHGVSAEAAHDHHARRLLDIEIWRVLRELKDSSRFSQRELSRKLGIALGLTNRIIRHLAQRRYVRIANSRKRCSYVITRAGLEAHAALSRILLPGWVFAFGEARGRIVAELREWATETGHATDITRVALIGINDLTQIAYVALQEMDLTLVGVLTEATGPPAPASFLGVPVRPLSELAALTAPLPMLVACVPGDASLIEKIEAAGISRDQVLWLSVPQEPSAHQQMRTAL